MLSATSDHKLGVLDNTNLLSYSSGSPKSDTTFPGLTSGCRWASISSGGSRGESVSLFFSSF